MNLHPWLKYYFRNIDYISLTWRQPISCVLLFYFKISACPGVNTILDFFNDFIKIELDFRLTF